MDLTVILLAGGTMLILALVAGYLLGLANKVFHVEVDPRIEAVNAALPGANCGGCGFVGCMSYAEAVAGGKAPPTKCTVGGEACAKEIAKIMGVEVAQSWPYRPAVHCLAAYVDRLGRHSYLGEKTCTAANLVSGVQGCAYGCMGFGDCARACEFDAIHVVDGLATVDYEKCVGCGACAKACPRNIISMTPFKADRMLIIACSNKDFGKDVRAVCKVGCIGCKACTKACGLFTVTDNLPRIDYDQYDPNTMNAAQLAIDKCPAKGIVYVGKPTKKDLEKVADKEAPALVEADFKTTVDKTEWQG